HRQPLLEPAEVVAEEPRFLGVRDEGALDQHRRPPGLPEHPEPAGHVLSRAPVVDDLDPAIVETQSDEPLLDRPRDAVPGALAAVARVDHESDLRAGRHASTFVLFRDRRTVEVWNRSPDPQRFEDWKNGSSGRIRTYNPPVNSRMLCR